MAKKEEERINNIEDSTPLKRITTRSLTKEKLKDSETEGVKIGSQIKAIMKEIMNKHMSKKKMNNMITTILFIRKDREN